MNTADTQLLGNRIYVLLEEGETDDAYQILFPVLHTRTPFRLLDVIGLIIGQAHPSTVNPFLNLIAADQTMGGWIIIASVVQQTAKIDLTDSLSAVCDFVIRSDVWYAADSFGERVPGRTLVEQFEPTIAILSDWRDHPNRWVRRMVGVAVHYWAKQARGKTACAPQVERLLDLLEPMFTEQEQDAIKGIGWGLKTLGRYYPEIVTGWLLLQVDRPHRALMLRKAVKYLPSHLRVKVTGLTA